MAIVVINHRYLASIPSGGFYTKLGGIGRVFVTGRPPISTPVVRSDRTEYMPDMSGRQRPGRQRLTDPTREARLASCLARLLGPSSVVLTKG